MALFFDAEWFNARLAAAHLARGDIARALGVSESQIADIWKDQRELSARDVAILAALLGAAPADIAHRAGISTPVPKSEPSLADVAARLARVEAALEEIKVLLRERAGG